LVAGAHRLAAAKQLGWDNIECFILRDELDDQSRLWEIAENLHRAELTALEKSELTDEWVKSCGQKLVTAE
jgi:ParB-like chromosome segregation protein Spo0J